MNKLDSFKKFVKTKPYLAYKVHSGLTSWQKLFEIYDVYGANHEIFDDGMKKSKPEAEPKAQENEVQAGNWKESVTTILKALQDVDVEKLSDSLNSFKNIFSLFERPKAQPSSIKRPYKRFED